MLAKACYCIGTATAAVMMADSVSALSTWKAIGEFGLAIVIATVSFVGLVWWVKRYSQAERKDVTRMAQRITDLETFQQQKLLEVIQRASEHQAQAVEAARENTAQLKALTRALEGRACLAISVLPPEKQIKVTRILRGDA